VGYGSGGGSLLFVARNQPADHVAPFTRLSMAVMIFGMGISALSLILARGHGDNQCGYWCCFWLACWSLSKMGLYSRISFVG
jgi:hypothetical protein